MRYRLGEATALRYARVGLAPQNSISAIHFLAMKQLRKVRGKSTTYKKDVLRKGGNYEQKEYNDVKPLKAKDDLKCYFKVQM